MAQERDERETAYGVAVQSLKNELRLAVRLLRQVKESEEAIAGEPQVIGAARDAFRHAVEALNRLPQLPPHEMQAVNQLMDQFRAALADLDL